MASGEQNTWWGSFVKAAKEKSITALEIIKTDFSEFATTMTNDTTNLINKASAQFIEKSNTASLLLDTFDNKLKIETNNKLKSSSTVQERYENELKSIQLNESTYLYDPEPLSDYEKWSEDFNTDIYKTAISDLLIENSSIRLIYSKLVPAQLSNDQFWCRYFFKVNSFEEEHIKRIKLLERVTDVTKLNSEPTLDWEDENEDETNVTSEILERAKNQDENLVKQEIEEASEKKETIEPTPENTDFSLLSNENLNLATSDKIEKIVKNEDADDWEKLSDMSDTEKKKLQENASEKPNLAENPQVPSENLPTKREANETDKKNNGEDWDEWE